MKIIADLFALVCAALMVTGVYLHEWYAGLGLVLFMAALIVSLAAHFGGEGKYLVGGGTLSSERN